VGTDEINFRSPVPARLELTGIIRQGNASGEYPAHVPARPVRTCTLRAFWRKQSFPCASQTTVRNSS